jgi:protein-S-isoprenylcysteine O-methyltransferase Ste14
MRPDIEEPINAIMSKLTAVANQDTADQIFNNVFSGEFGKRGEQYVIAQVVLVLCILGGGLPFFGGTLQFIFGPVMMAIGASTILLGITDMGASLSPWPIPTTGEDLITTGLFSKIRHPLYAGLIAFMGGLSIATGSAERLILTAALFYTLDAKSDFEEKELTKEYSTYDDYKKVVTGKFFPSELLDLLPWKNSQNEEEEDEDNERKMITGQAKWEL